MATVSFSMYFPLMLPFENRGALSKVLENVWGLFLGHTTNCPPYKKASEMLGLL